MAKRRSGKTTTISADDPQPETPAPIEYPGWVRPATTLLVADILMRGSSILTRRFVERKLLKTKYGHETAEGVLRRQSGPVRLSALALSRLGTGSVPGAVLVGGGLLAKALYDRADSYRKGKRRKGKAPPE